MKKDKKPYDKIILYEPSIKEIYDKVKARMEQDQKRQDEKLPDGTDLEELSHGVYEAE